VKTAAVVRTGSCQISGRDCCGVMLQASGVWRVMRSCIFTSWPNRMDKKATVVERVGWGLASAFILIVASGVLYLLCVAPEPRRSVGDVVASVLRWEFFLALLLFSCTGLAWAVTGSGRLEALFYKASGKALLFLALWLLLGAICGVLFGVF
jgi:hypothetical protein